MKTLTKIGLSILGINSCNGFNKEDSEIRSSDRFRTEMECDYEYKNYQKPTGDSRNYLCDLIQPAIPNCEEYSEIAIYGVKNPLEESYNAEESWIEEPKDCNLETLRIPQGNYLKIFDNSGYGLFMDSKHNPSRDTNFFSAIVMGYCGTSELTDIVIHFSRSESDIYRLEETYKKILPNKFLPKEYEGLTLSGYDIPTISEISCIRFLEEENYSSRESEPSYLNKNEMKIEGQFYYCVKEDLSKNPPTIFGCDIRSGDIILKKNRDIEEQK